jgi:hypothetical protein
MTTKGKTYDGKVRAGSFTPNCVWKAVLMLAMLQGACLAACGAMAAKNVP